MTESLISGNRTKRISRLRSASSKPAKPALASVLHEPAPTPTAELAAGAAAIALSAAEVFDPALAATTATAPEMDVDPHRSSGSGRADDLFGIGGNPLDALAESQTAMARGLEAIAVETAVLAGFSLSAVAEAAAAMLDARTFADAVKIQAGLTRRSINTVLDGSTRLSEIGVKAAAEAARPILARFDGMWRAG